eukprot:TRINITY_DN62497_c0_g1_i1.p1 TRINITY_DN62497_c0_g1~~TRINITY_DN62497_c0_g1_i1.p1  ORF type:complete len:633 (+),score=88.93 TRINITY_DN62497_c0_g1_i1:59-1900(+)
MRASTNSNMSSQRSISGQAVSSIASAPDTQAGSTSPGQSVAAQPRVTGSYVGHLQQAGKTMQPSSSRHSMPVVQLMRDSSSGPVGGANGRMTVYQPSGKAIARSPQAQQRGVQPQAGAEEYRHASPTPPPIAQRTPPVTYSQGRGDPGLSPAPTRQGSAHAPSTPKSDWRNPADAGPSGSNSEGQVSHRPGAQPQVGSSQRSPPRYVSSRNSLPRSRQLTPSNACTGRSAGPPVVTALSSQPMTSSSARAYSPVEQHEQLVQHTLQQQQAQSPQHQHQQSPPRMHGSPLKTGSLTLPMGLAEGQIRQPRWSHSPREGGRSEDWQRLPQAFESLREEMKRVCEEQVESVRAEVTSMLRQTERYFGEALRDERTERAAHAGQVQTFLQSLDVQVHDCQRALATVCPELVGTHGVVSALRQVDVFGRELEDERTFRCERIAELHDRLSREVGALTKAVEEQRISALKVAEQERSDRCEDTKEIRAIMNSVWSQASSTAVGCAKETESSKKAYFFRYADADGQREEFKEMVGDPEDINTLYEMVREALGDTVNLRQQLEEEAVARGRETSSCKQRLDQMTRQLNTLQALLRDVTPAAAHREDSQFSGDPDADDMSEL